MFLVIYDHNNTGKIFHIKRPLEDIQRIDVQVLSGDEVVKILYFDGDFDVGDSSKTRLYDYDDRNYYIKPCQLQQWASFKPNRKQFLPTFSYDRADWFLEEVGKGQWNCSW